MKKILHSLPILCFILLTACEKPSEIPLAENPVSANRIQLDNLQVGQKSVYTRAASCQHHVKSDTTFKSLKDTLVLEIISSDANGFLVKETVNQLSPICGYKETSSPSPFFFTLKKTGDSLTSQTQFGTDSRVSQIYSNRTIPLRPMTSNLKKLDKWLLPELTADTYWGSTDPIIRDNFNFGTANIWWNGTSIVVDGPYRGLIYNNQNGIIALIALGSQLPQGIIWYLQPK
jgi:hypothetical protein